MLKRNEFEALCLIMDNPGITQRDLAERMGVSLGAANNVHRKLTQAKLLKDGKITARGKRELEPYKVQNAIIMAAGMSSRFAPISYEMPKGILKVRGEVLVERQIKQLQEAGIDDITVVVGYKKEVFFHLEEDYGVKIVINDEYASRNNNSTLYRVRDQLGNTYICASDTYFTENPFSKYEWKANYPCAYTAEPTDEWVVITDSKGRIVKVEIGYDSGWYMTDHAYFDRAFSERFVEILEEVYDDPRTASKLWEDIYSEHIDELDMEIKECKDGVFYEFDTLDELREFDPFFKENVDSSILDNIVSVLGCKKTEIRDVFPLKQGLTNLSCHFTTNDGEYVYRHPGIGTENMIDRKAEMEALTLARDIGIDETFIYENPDQGWKISKFIVNARELDPHDEAQLAEAMEVARRLHEQDLTLERHFDYLQEGLSYEKLLLEKGPIQVPGYYELRDQALRVRECAAGDDAPECLTHNDFFYLNLLYDEQDNLSLIDWEYAGMSDYASDYGTFVVTCELDEDEADKALELYFGRTPTLEERRHNYAFIGLAGWCWYVWSLQKESDGDFVGEWLYIYYRYAKKYLPKALELYEGKE
ncbi:MAG: phosphotransferase [Coriobacteriales bacterium]|nr:phosphotransferase [Coriobacteriales bacterium]